MMNELKDCKAAIEFEKTKILDQWKNETLIFLATSSEIRKAGIIAEGFKQENIQLVSPPEVFELTAVDTYLDNFNPSAQDLRRNIATFHASFSKAISLSASAPSNALWCAWDTLAQYYDVNPKFGGDDEREKIWNAQVERKPASLPKAKEAVNRLFLILVRNHRRFLETHGEPEQDTEELRNRMDYASAIVVNTTTAIRFPDENRMTLNTGKIFLRPQRLYKIAGQIKDRTPDDMRQPSPDEIGSMELLDGSTVQDAVADIVDTLFEKINEKQIDPTKISGGVPYHDADIRDTLGIMALPENREDEIDPGIYTGFPKTIFRSMLEKKAEEIARKNIGAY